MIIVTGAYGFIGSCLVQALNEGDHRTDIIVVDDFYKDKKEPNLEGKSVREWIHRDIFLKWFEKSASVVDAIFHLGARTDTIEKDKAIFDRLNLEYSKRIWEICTMHDVPMIYASSAATYGGGEMGFVDSHEIVEKLAPLNEYAISKNEFDKWALAQKDAPAKWVGMKFFNVFGPNEYHKKRMASVIFHAFHQINETGGMNLFRSHRSEIQDGHQSRDFIYVKDVVDICQFFLNNEVENGLYNVGTGKARTFLDLTNATFKAMDLEPDISYVDTPMSIRDSYQYFTEASTKKLLSAGYNEPFTSLEDGVTDYVKHYLKPKKNW